MKNYSRNKLIDIIEDEYNTHEDNILTDTIEELFGIAPDEIDDSDYDEGMYHDFRTSQLSQLLSRLDELTYPTHGKQPIVFSNRELYLLREAMNAYADPSFSRSRNDSAIARHILRKLDEV